MLQLHLSDRQFNCLLKCQLRGKCFHLMTSLCLAWQSMPLPLQLNWQYRSGFMIYDSFIPSYGQHTTEGYTTHLAHLNMALSLCPMGPPQLIAGDDKFWWIVTVIEADAVISLTAVTACPATPMGSRESAKDLCLVHIYPSIANIAYERQSIIFVGY